MFKTSRIAATFAVGVAIVSCAHTNASAASAITNMFVNDVNPNVDLLDRSSRLALQNSQDPRVRAFARSEAKEQTITANDIYDWSQSDARRIFVASSEPAGTGAVITGRSVAVDKPVVAIPEQMPSANQEDVDRLYGLSGKEFDEAYKAVQTEALKALLVTYQEYITNSDEPALKTIATRELPKINQRLAELSRL